MKTLTNRLRWLLPILALAPLSGCMMGPTHEQMLPGPNDVFTAPVKGVSTSDPQNMSVVRQPEHKWLRFNRFHRHRKGRQKRTDRCGGVRCTPKSSNSLEGAAKQAV